MFCSFFYSIVVSFCWLHNAFITEVIYLCIYIQLAGFAFFFWTWYTYWVFWGGKLSPDFCDHMISLLMLDCKSSIVLSRFLPLQVSVWSSANTFAWTGALIFLIISFISIRNRVTLNTNLCGNPFLIAVLQEGIYSDFEGSVFKNLTLVSYVSTVKRTTSFTRCYSARG